MTERMAGKFGKGAAYFPRALKSLGTYSSLPTAPPSLDLTVGVASWPMFLNDTYGCCTIAAVGHMDQSWDVQANSTDPIPADDQIGEVYFGLSHGQDSGLVEADVLHAWRTAGFWGTKILGYAPISTHDPRLLTDAVSLFGGAYLGIAVPANAQAQFRAGDPWDLDPGWQQQQIVGGHAIPALGYDNDGLIVITWGAIQRMSWAWWRVYGTEAWGVLPGQFAEAGAAQHVDIDALTHDLAIVASEYLTAA